MTTNELLPASDSIVPYLFAVKLNMAHPQWPPGAQRLDNPNQPYYVIVGAGTSALINHLTLVAAGKVNRASRVLHIGRPDPWQLYERVRMGQWPVLLQFPAATIEGPDIDVRDFR